MAKLELQNVTLAYGDHVVLKEVSFWAMPGETLGFIGPNGCGKSTLIRAISRVIKPVSGRILLDGRDTFKMPRGELARLIAVVPQAPFLPEVFTAFEVVLMGRTPHLGLFRYESRKDMELSLRAMEVTRTLHLMERRVGELSGGEKQRLVVARALAQEPKVLLLDEPTAHLDINHQVKILDLIKILCVEQKLTVVVALHDLNLASQYCDRVILLNGGWVCAEGMPEEVINPRNIKMVYGAEVLVLPHPLNGLPTVLAVGDGHKLTKGRRKT